MTSTGRITVDNVKFQILPKLYIAYTMQFKRKDIFSTFYFQTVVVMLVVLPCIYLLNVDVLLLVSVKGKCTNFELKIF